MTLGPMPVAPARQFDYNYIRHRIERMEKLWFNEKSSDDQTQSDVPTKMKTQNEGIPG